MPIEHSPLVILFIARLKHMHGSLTRTIASLDDGSRLWLGRTSGAPLEDITDAHRAALQDQLAELDKLILEYEVNPDA